MSATLTLRVLSSASVARRGRYAMPATSAMGSSQRHATRVTALSRRRQFSNNPPPVEPEMMARLVEELNAEASLMLGELGDPDFDLDESESRPRPAGSRRFDFDEDYVAEPPPVKTQPRRADTDEYRLSHETLQEGDPEFQRSLQVPLYARRRRRRPHHHRPVASPRGPSRSRTQHARARRMPHPTATKPATVLQSLLRAHHDRVISDVRLVVREEMRLVLAELRSERR